MVLGEVAGSRRAAAAEEPGAEHDGGGGRRGEEEAIRAEQPLAGNVPQAHGGPARVLRLEGAFGGQWPRLAGQGRTERVVRCRRRAGGGGRRGPPCAPAV